MKHLRQKDSSLGSIWDEASSFKRLVIWWTHGEGLGCVVVRSEVSVVGSTHSGGGGAVAVKTHR